MKKLIFIAACLVTFTASAQEKFFCALPRAVEFREVVLEMDGSDKTRHCSLMCIIALKCNRHETYLLGVAKEIFDSLGFGTPDANDIEANKTGISLATSGTALSEYDCLDQCTEIYPAR